MSLGERGEGERKTGRLKGKIVGPEEVIKIKPKYRELRPYFLKKSATDVYFK
jgi:hypothetical protein